jgi:hypothetical protein
MLTFWNNGMYQADCLIYREKVEIDGRKYIKGPRKQSLMRRLKFAIAVLLGKAEAIFFYE